MPRFSSLRVRLLLPVLLAMGPLAALVLYATEERNREAELAAGREAAGLARMGAVSEARLIEGGRQLLATAAKVPTVLGGDRILSTLFLADLLRRNPRYLNFAMTEPDGRVVYSGARLPAGASCAGLPSLARAVATREFAVGEYRMDAETGSAALDFALPLLGKSGDVQRVMVARWRKLQGTFTR
ncbi:MAG: hypothetical protein AAB368_15780, partial [bacterium]